MPQQFWPPVTLLTAALITMLSLYSYISITMTYLDNASYKRFVAVTKDTCGPFY